MTSHCCVCAQGCNHTGGPSYCEGHLPDRGRFIIDQPLYPQTFHDLLSANATQEKILETLERIEELLKQPGKVDKI